MVLTPAPVPTKAMPALPALPTPVKAMPSQPQHPFQPPLALGPRPPNYPPPGKAAGAQPSAIPKAGAAGRLRSLRLRGRFAIYRRLLRFHRLLPKGSVGRAYHRRGGSEAVSEEVRPQPGSRSTANTTASCYSYRSTDCSRDPDTEVIFEPASEEDLVGQVETWQSAAGRETRRSSTPSRTKTQSRKDL